MCPDNARQSTGTTSGVTGDAPTSSAPTSNPADTPPDEAMLVVLHDDLTRVLDRHIDAHADLSTRPIQLIQLNGLVLTIVVALVSEFQSGLFVSPLGQLGVVLLVLSTVVALAGYRLRAVELGPGTTVARHALSYRMTAREYLWWMTKKGTPRFIESVSAHNDRRSRYVQWSLYLFLAGLFALLVGILTI